MKKHLLTGNFKKLFFSWAFIAISVFSFDLHGQVELEQHTPMNVQGLRFWYSDPGKVSHKFNRNITPTGDCMQYANGYIFFAWYKGGMQTRNLMLSRLNLATNNWVTIQFPDKSSLYTAGEYKGGGNSHRTACIGVSKIDGTVHMVYDMHADNLKYRFSKKNIAFAPDSEFKLSNFNDKRNYFRPGEPTLTFTYPNIGVSKDGELILEYRKGTSRQGDKYLIIYNGTEWSKPKLVMQGDNENPEFNQYGGFRFFFDKLYMGCAVRIKGDAVEFNKGFYFADAGINGVSEAWKDIKGNSHQLPIKGLTEMNKLRVAQPLPNGNKGMTSAPSFVVSKNGAIHFTNRVSGLGTVHYYSKPGSTNMIKASGGSPTVNFAADDGRVYSIELVSDKIRLKSTKEGEHNWRTDYDWSGSEKFGLMRYEYHNGKIYIIAAEKKESDKVPLHFIVLNLKNIISVPDAIGPEGYKYSTDEKGTVSISDVPYDIAFGQDGKYAYLTNQTENVSCDINSFGSDPFPGTKKYCFVKESKVPYSGTAMQVPGTIEAEYFDFGGQGVSYNDSDPENKGAEFSNFRTNDGVDIGEGTTGKGIGWSANGEWTEYTVDVESSGDYNLEFIVASKNGGGELGVDLDGITLLTGIIVPQTNDWDSYTSFMEKVSLDAGEHVMRFNVEKSGFNLDKIEASKVVTTGLEDEISSLSVYPNPSTSGEFHLSTVANWEVFTLQGVPVTSGQSDVIKLTGESKRVYLLKVNNHISKLVVQ